MDPWDDQRNSEILSWGAATNSFVLDRASDMCHQPLERCSQFSSQVF